MTHREKEMKFPCFSFSSSSAAAAASFEVFVWNDANDMKDKYSICIGISREYEGFFLRNSKSILWNVDSKQPNWGKDKWERKV